MSYLLAALKRAESERSRGEVPGLHAQPTALVPPAEGRRAVAWWVAGGAALALSGVLAVVSWPRPDRPVAAVVPAPGGREVLAPVVPVSPVSVPARVDSPATPQPGRAEAPAARVASATDPVRPRVVLAPSGGASESPLPAVPSPRVRAVAAASAAASSDEERVYAVAELPAQIRSQLPTLTVGGASYSESPASRMLILNGQLYHEGDKLAPELTLQQIQLRRAVLSFRGYRYAISY